MNASTFAIAIIITINIAIISNVFWFVFWHFDDALSRV